MATYFADFSATNDGDGTSPVQASTPGGVGAFNTLNGHVIESDNIIWCRRVSSPQISATWNINEYNNSFIGWPKSSDDLYDSRPSAARELWDGDSADYATILLPTTDTTICVNITTDGNKFYNIKVFAPTGPTIVHKILNITSVATDNEFHNCWFEQQYTATNSNSSYNYISILIEGARTTMNDCKVIGGCTGIYGGTFYITGTRFRAKNLQVEIKGHGTQSTNAFYLTGYYHYIQGVKFTISGTTYAANYPSICFECSSSTITGIEVECTNASYTSWPLIHAKTHNSINGLICEFTKLYSLYCDNRSVYLGSSNSGRKCIFIFKEITSSGYICKADIYNAVVSFTNCYAGSTSAGFMYTTYARENVKILLNNSTTPYGDLVSSYFRVQKSFCHYLDENNLLMIKTAGGDLVSSSTHRAGGTNYSYKYAITSTPYTTRGLFRLSDSYPELIWLNLAIGHNVITLYGAYKNYLSTDLPIGGEHLWFEVEYLDTSDLVQITRSEALLPDTTEWIGDTDLTKFKMQVTVESNSVSVVPVRLYLGAPVASLGYIYIDPSFQIT